MVVAAADCPLPGMPREVLYEVCGCLALIGALQTSTELRCLLLCFLASPFRAVYKLMHPCRIDALCHSNKLLLLHPHTTA
jgi:hypothetical protein